MKQTIKSTLKYFRFLYRIYFYVGSWGLKILKLFIKPQENLILFISYGGKKYDDSPKAIFEQMLKDIRCKGFEYVWAFEKPEKFNISNAKKIKVDTFKYFYTALKARCWVTNSAVERGLSFKGKNTFYFNTWHGTPIKKMGTDIAINNESFRGIGKMPVDIMLAQGDFDADIFSNVFEIERSKFEIIGLPRNDELAEKSKKIKNDILKKLGIPQNKKVILYAPTFREFDRDSNKNCVISPPINLERWNEALGDKYLILFRAHYEVADVLNISMHNKLIYNASDYANLNELILASDLLISDYSSIFFDYSITGKPMLCFAYDFDEYTKKRGLYFDIKNELPSGIINNELELLNEILNLNDEKNIEKVVEFRKKYIKEFGNATAKSIEIIVNNLKK